MTAAGTMSPSISRLGCAPSAWGSAVRPGSGGSLASLRSSLRETDLRGDSSTLFLAALLLPADLGSVRLSPFSRDRERPVRREIYPCQGGGPMKITGYELFKVAPRWLFLKVTTDEGYVGWGEPIVEGRADTVKTAVDELMGYLIGKDPMRIEDHWQVMYRGGFYRGGPVL